MRMLSIVRHAKAERPEDYANDFERPLTERGHKDASIAASVLTKLTPLVDYVMSSPANRAAQTAAHIADLLEFEEPISWNESIYLATAETLLETLKGTPDKARHVVIVGHNPGLEELATALCTGKTGGSAVRLPTAGLAHLELDISRWSLIRWSTGRLKVLVSPKLLK